MLRKVRIVLATIFFIGICLLFADVTGVLHHYLGWMAKIQFVPAALALNFLIVAALLVLTLVFGRVYCSVICPLGIMQDIISWIHGKMPRRIEVKRSQKRGGEDDKSEPGKASRKWVKGTPYRFHFRRPLRYLRYGVLVVFIAVILLGATSVAALIEPYSTFGRIATELFSPVYRGVNNLLALVSEHFESYAFYPAEVWIKSIPTFIAAVVALLLVGFFAWKWGRGWCNSVCPVGAMLGLVSRFSLFAPKIDTEKCRNCGLCAKRCKAGCIDLAGGKRIDYSRCVVCFDCVDSCRAGALKYEFRYGKPQAPVQGTGKADARSEAPAREASSTAQAETPRNESRRAFMKATALTVGAAAGAELLRPAEAFAQNMKVDGGLITPPAKQAPRRETPLRPAGASSLKDFSTRCIACQLCVSACPNGVLRPSTDLDTFMQPEMSYEKGYCRPECTRCSSVCPAGAILPVSREEKSSIQIGHSVVDYSLCIAATEGVKCGNCARHCPVGAIRLVKKDPEDPDSPRIPSVDETRCIGCGACEYVCPANPLSAIHVEGHPVHKEI